MSTTPPLQNEFVKEFETIPTRQLRSRIASFSIRNASGVSPDNKPIPEDVPPPDRTTECSICAETYNKRARLPVKCLYCDYTACRTCCQTYVLNEPSPRCMNPDCAKVWTLHFMRKSFTNSFVNVDLKAHREDVLFQQEIALLPATQPIVEREIRKEQIHNEIRLVNQQIAELNVRISALWRQYNNEVRMGNHSTSSVTRAEFVRNCPDTDCRGFLSTQWKCGICSKWSCPTCHEVKGLDKNAEHTCDPANVATAELLAHDTRHCPKCTAPIFKIDGCDQMWCTQCQTGFSWRTGRIETRVHNPHYFEWLQRTNGRVDMNTNEHICERELTQNIVHVMERLLFAKTTQPVSVTMTNTSHPRNHAEYIAQIKLHRHPNAEPTLAHITNIVRSILHVQAVDREKYNTNYILENQDLRVMYMRKLINAERFKTLIQQRNKRLHKHGEIRNVIDVVVNATSDILLRFQEYLRNSLQTECDISILNEINTIREYANECLADISHTYGSVLLQFDDTLRLISV
jgi:hypothetical protein